MSDEPNFSGIWRSAHTFYSQSRKAEIESEHYVTLQLKGNKLVVQSLAGSKSYLLIRLSLDDLVATGSWETHTDKDGYYKGAVYYGAIQLIIDPGKQKMEGKWVGYGADMHVRDGHWEIARIGH